MAEPYPTMNVKAQPHAAMLRTHDRTFQSPRDAAKSHAMLWDAFSNMINILLLILEHLSWLFSNCFQQNDGHFMSIHVISVSKFLNKDFFMSSL